VRIFFTINQAAPLRGAGPGRASRRACGTYGADPARRAGLRTQHPLIARLIVALVIPREACAVFLGVSVSRSLPPGQGRHSGPSHAIAPRPLTR